MSGTERIANDEGTAEEGQPGGAGVDLPAPDAPAPDAPAPDDSAVGEVQLDPEHARLDLNAEQWDDE
jgi:hypothetical protein